MTFLIAANVLPASILESAWFSVLARFVAVNTILYVALSIFKIAPKIYLSDFVRQVGRRSETRSIYPDDPHEPSAVATRQDARPGPDGHNSDVGSAPA